MTINQNQYSQTRNSGNKAPENKISKIMPSSYADCIIMGYDVTNKQSFEDIKTYWIDKIKNRSNIDLIYLKPFDII